MLELFTCNKRVFISIQVRHSLTNSIANRRIETNKYRVTNKSLTKSGKQKSCLIRDCELIKLWSFVVAPITLMGLGSSSA